jgi:hypothetical protein
MTGDCSSTCTGGGAAKAAAAIGGGCGMYIVTGIFRLMSDPIDTPHSTRYYAQKKKKQQHTQILGVSDRRAHPPSTLSQPPTDLIVAVDEVSLSGRLHLLTGELQRHLTSVHLRLLRNHIILLLN